MTDTSNHKILRSSSATCRRREAKRFAWNCFLRKENTLLLIGATLIPIVMFIAAQGIYTMLYFALEDMSFLTAELMQVIDVLLTALSVPPVGGLIYIATGLARGKERQIKDVFYPYTSPRAFFRTIMALLLPGAAIYAIVWVTTMAIHATQGLYELSALMEEKAALFYSDVFWFGGILAAVGIGLVGLILTGYVLPFLWLVFCETDQSLIRLLSRSVHIAHGQLLPWLFLQCSFLGWVALSGATAGILLVLFVIPYYLLTVTRYVDLSYGVEPLPDE